MYTYVYILCFLFEAGPLVCSLPLAPTPPPTPTSLSVVHS